MGLMDDGQVRTTVAVVAVVFAVLLVLILINSQFSTILDDDEDDGPDDEYPDWLEPPPIVVGEDNEWEDRDEKLANPLIITNGTKLEVVRSELRVELIDLVLGNQSWITVEERGTLELVDTNLSIVYQDWLESAVVASGHKYRGRPYAVSRAVNLRETEGPVLSFDLRWYLGKGDLTVAVQPSPGECMTVLKAIEPDLNRTDDWTHCTVPLVDYAGEVVRVILFTDDRGYKDVILGNLNITDGGSELPNDGFPTGKPWEDGWRCDNFNPFFLSMSFDLDHWRPLIESRGEMVVERSDLKAPEGLYRGDYWYSSSKYQAESYGEWQINRGPSWSETSSGGHVIVQGGTLTCREAWFYNVPVIVQEGEVDIEEVVLDGDGDLLALDQSYGTIFRSRFQTFVFDPIQGRGYSSEVRSIGTAISISFNSTEGPVHIAETRIDGSYIGLDLNHAWVEMEDCTIDDIGWIAIWDHDCKGLYSWGEVNSTNEVGSAELFKYFRTHTAVFEMEGPGRPRESPSRVGVFTGEIDWSGMPYDGYTLNNRIIHVDHYRTYILMPTHTVDGDGRHTRLQYVVVHGWNSWGGYEHVVLETDLRSGTIQMDPDLADDYGAWDTRLRYMFAQSYAGYAGMVAISIDVDVPKNYSDSYWVNFYLDGEIDAAFSNWEGNDTRWGGYENAFNHTFTVPPGRHALGIEIVGQSRYNITPVQLLNDTRWYYYASAVEEVTEVQDFIEEGCGTAIIGSGVQFTLDRWPTSLPEEDEETLAIFLERWSQLRISGEGIPTNGTVKLHASGPGDLDVRNIHLQGLSLNLDRCDLTCDNVTSEVVEFSFDGGNQGLSNITSSNATEIHTSSGAYLHLADSKLAVHENWYSSIISVSEATAIVTNITVGDDEGRGLSAHVRRNSTFVLTNSSFIGGGLVIYASVYSNWHLPVNASVLVSDCTFQGEEASLQVWDHGYYWIEDGSFLRDSRIRNNHFIGDSVKVVCHRHLVDWILEDNSFGDASTLYVMYDLYYRWPEGKSSSDYRVEYHIDEDVITVSEEALGNEWDRHSPIFAKGEPDPLSFEDPAPIPIVIKEEYYYSSHGWGWWVIGFSYLDPTATTDVLDVPEWEHVSEVIWAFYGDEWNLGN